MDPVETEKILKHLFKIGCAPSVLTNTTVVDDVLESRDLEFFKEHPYKIFKVN